METRVSRLLPSSGSTVQGGKRFRRKRRDESKMELVGYTPVTVKSHWLPVQETRLIPIGDIQYGASSDIERLKRYLDWGMKQKAYFVGMGDRKSTRLNSSHSQISY